MSALVDTPARAWNRGVKCGRQLGFMMAYVAGLWFLPIVIVIFVGLAVVQGATGGWGDGGQWNSLWEHSLQPFRYFPMAMGIMVGAGMLPSYVAHGLTRREFSIGTTLMVAGTALALAVFGAVGLGMENVIFGWFGQNQTFTVPQLYTDAGDVLPVIGVYWLLTAIHMATGLLIGSCFYRFGGLIGTALVLINVLPVLAVEGLLSVSYFGQLTLDAFGWERQPLALVIPASLGIIALTLYVHYVFIRRITIKP